MSVWVSGFVLLDTRHFDLLETPLRQVDVPGSKVATHIIVPQSEGRSQSSELRVVVRSRIPDDFNSPVVLGVANSCIAVARNLPISLGNGCCDLVRVQVAASLCVNETDDIAIANILDRCLCIELGLMSVGIEEPVVVRILVVIASDLLLLRSFRICLYVRME